MMLVSIYDCYSRALQCLVLRSFFLEYCPRDKQVNEKEYEMSQASIRVHEVWACTPYRTKLAMITAALGRSPGVPSKLAR
jgi:hypothetical protein